MTAAQWLLVGWFWLEYCHSCWMTHTHEISLCFILSVGPSMLLASLLYLSPQHLPLLLGLTIFLPGQSVFHTIHHTITETETYILKDIPINWIPQQWPWHSIDQGQSVVGWMKSSQSGLCLWILIFPQWFLQDAYKNFSRRRLSEWKSSLKMGLWSG